MNNHKKQVLAVMLGIGLVGGMTSNVVGMEPIEEKGKASIPSQPQFKGSVNNIIIFFQRLFRKIGLPAGESQQQVGVYHSKMKNLLDLANENGLTKNDVDKVIAYLTDEVSLYEKAAIDRNINVKAEVALLLNAIGNFKMVFK